MAQTLAAKPRDPHQRRGASLAHLHRLGLAALLLAGVVAPAAGQSPPVAALPPLTFFGLRAGSTLSATANQIRLLGGSELACRPARSDPKVRDCRAGIRDPSQQAAPTLDVWLSAIDSLVAVMTVAGPVAEEQLVLWREALESAFGLAPTDTAGPQSMLQWVRHRQMLRLTWRVGVSGTVASVSLVDGPILDGWGRRRSDRGDEKGLP